MDDLPGGESYPVPHIRNIECLCGHVGGWHSVGRPHQCLFGRAQKGELGSCHCRGFCQAENNDIMKDLCSK